MNEGPAGAPPELTAARDRAPETATTLARARDNLGQGSVAPEIQPGGRPARLLAALPAGEAIPRGVIRRAAVEARGSGRTVQVYAIGEGGEASAATAAAMLRAEGVRANVELFRPTRPTPARVELYLLP